MTSATLSPSFSRLLQAYRRHLATYDRWFDRCLQRFPAQIACRAGCSACCRALFDVSLLDAALLQEGMRRLPPALQDQVRDRARPIVARLQSRWPEFAHPFTLNHRPEAEWDIAEEDATPCPLLGDDGRCLVYAWRPPTCRLHGLPNVDPAGEIFQGDWCTRNFVGEDPLRLSGLHWPFRQAFAEEVAHYRRFAAHLWGGSDLERDTFIPAALFIDFSRWESP